MKRSAFAAVLATALVGANPGPAAADQGGISLWLPGSFGSLAATPMVPGWGLATIYYHTPIAAGGGVAASRAINLPNRSVNLNINLKAELDATADVGILSPTYVFATPVFGGQFAISVLGIYGRQEATIDATLNGNLVPIGFGPPAQHYPIDRRLRRHLRAADAALESGRAQLHGLRHG